MENTFDSVIKKLIKRTGWYFYKQQLKSKHLNRKQTLTYLKQKRYEQRNF